jgi:UDP-glucuronate 4-epimerase
VDWRGRIAGRVLVTGAAGFIGAALAEGLVAEGVEVVGLDDLNAYYDPRLKAARLARLEGRAGWRFVKGSLADREGLGALVEEVRPDWVVNLAAQAGVRHSIENPHAYGDANLTGFLNLLEACRARPPRHLVYASSSSVYGFNANAPFSVHDNVDHPVSLYAATKKSNELVAHTYAHLYGLPCTGLRFFTVYGPWGRPDMAYFSFTKAILEGRPIQVYNNGRMKRDFTYIDDIVEGVVRVMARIPEPNPDFDHARPDPGSSTAPYKIYNIGNNDVQELGRFIEVIEEALGKRAEKIMLPMQPGDVPMTYADVDDLVRDVGYKPDTPIEVGIGKFVDWYRTYYGC